MTTTTVPPNGVWLSSKQAAERIGIHPMTLARWRHDGRGPRFEKLGPGRACHTRYHVDDVDEWMRSGKAGAA